jgi:hypothetical protein
MGESKNAVYCILEYKSGFYMKKCIIFRGFFMKYIRYAEPRTLF